MESNQFDEPHDTFLIGFFFKFFLLHFVSNLF